MKYTAPANTPENRQKIPTNSAGVQKITRKTMASKAMQKKKAARCLTLELENASDRGVFSPLTSPEASPTGAESLSFTNILNANWAEQFSQRSKHAAPSNPFQLYSPMPPRHGAFEGQHIPGCGVGALPALLELSCRLDNLRMNSGGAYSTPGALHAATGRIM